MKFSKSIIDRLVFSDVDYLEKAEDPKAEFVEEKSPPRAAKYAESNAHESQTDEELDANFDRHNPTNKSVFSVFDEILEKAYRTNYKPEPEKERSTIQHTQSKATDPEERAMNATMHTWKDNKGKTKQRVYDYDSKKQAVDVVNINPRTAKNRGGKGSKTITANAAHEKELKNASVFSVFDEILEKGRRGKNKEQLHGPKRVQESEGEGVELPGGSMATMGNPGSSKEKVSFERAEPGAIRNLKKLAESPNKMDRKAAEAGLKRH